MADQPNKKTTDRVPVLKLLIWSLVIGWLLWLFNSNPGDVYAWLGETGKAIFDWIFSLAQAVGPYILMGSMLVLPVWAFLRWRRSRKER